MTSRSGGGESRGRFPARSVASNGLTLRAPSGFLPCKNRWTPETFQELHSASYVPPRRGSDPRFLQSVSEQLLSSRWSCQGLRKPASCLLNSAAA